jgi:predicted small secreted protein
MKKLGLLTTLLIGSLLLTGCNNNQETMHEENSVLT